MLERFFKIITAICSQGLKIDETNDCCHNNIESDSTIKDDIKSLLAVGHGASLPKNSIFHKTATFKCLLSSDPYDNPGRRAGHGWYFYPE